MTTATITLKVDSYLAQCYTRASVIDQSKLSLLLELWLREMFLRATPLPTVLDTLSDNAQARGLTTEKLAELLDAR